MSEQEENNGAEEQGPAIDLTSEEMGFVPNEGTDTEALETLLIGKIINEVSGDFEVLEAIATEGAEWDKEPAKNIPAEGGTEFEVSLTITDGDELTGTIHLSGGIDLYFDVNGEENHASSSQKELGVMVESSISPGSIAHATWKLVASPTE